MNALDLALKLTAQDSASGPVQKVELAVHGAGVEMDKTTREATELAQAVNNIKSDRLSELEAKAGVLVGRMDAASDATKNLNTVLEKTRNTGLAMAAVGAGGLALTNHLIQTSEEGRSLEARLESLAKAQGRFGDVGQINDIIANVTVKAHLPDDDPVREAAIQMMSDQVSTSDLPNLLEAAARNAETLKAPVDEVGKLFAKAYAEGDLGRLKRANILFSNQEEEAVKAAFAISEVAGRAKFMEVVMSSTARGTGELGTGLTQTQIAANDAARALDDAMTNMGEGAAEAKQNLDSLTAQLLVMANTNPELQKTMGYVLGVGSAGLTAAGGVLSLASQVGLASLGLKAMGISGTLSFTALKAGALSTSAALLPLLGYALLIGIAIAGFAIAFYGARDAGTMAADDLIEKWGVLGELWDSLANKLSNLFEKNKAAGDAAGAQVLEGVNKKRREKGLKELTQEEFDAGKNTYAPGIDDGLRKNGRAKTADELALENKGKSAPAMPGMPFSSAGANLPIVSTDSIITGATPTGPGAAAADSGEDIMALQDAITRETDKDKKKALQIMLRHAKEAQKKAKADSKHAHQMQELDEKIRQAESAAQADIAAAKGEAALKAQSAADDKAMKARLKAIEQQKDAGLLDAETAQERSEQVREYYAAMQRRREAQNALHKAEIEANAEIEKANIEAKNQTGKEKETTLALARINADKIRKLAQIEHGGAANEALPTLGGGIGGGGQNGALLDYVKSGGSLLDLKPGKKLRRRGVIADGALMPRSGERVAVGSGSSVARIGSQQMDASGNYIDVQFEKIRVEVPRNGWDDL